MLLKEGKIDNDGEGLSLHEALEELTDEYIFNELAEYNFDRYANDICLSHVEFHWRGSMTFYRMDIRIRILYHRLSQEEYRVRSSRSFPRLPIFCLRSCITGERNVIGS